MKLRFLSAGSGAVLSLVFASITSATPLEKLDLGELINESETCVAGTVLSKTVEQRNGQVVTLTTFLVTQSAYGNVAKTITVTTPGGARNMGRLKVSEVVAGSPQFFQNQENILFLSKSATASEYSVVGFNQGIFPVLETENGTDIVTLSNNPRTPMMLDSAMQYISDYRKNGAPNSINQRGE